MSLCCADVRNESWSADELEASSTTGRRAARRGGERSYIHEPTRTTTAMPARSGTATRRTRWAGWVAVSEAHISVTAATGDIVRPAAAPSETTAPTCSGAQPRLREGAVNRPNRLWVAAIP